MTAQLQEPGQGIDTIAFGADTMTLKADATTSDDSFVVLETTMSPGGFVPPLHLHREMAECIYVLEGRLDVRVGDERRIAVAGAFIGIPAGTPHTMQPAGEEQVRTLMLLSNPTRAMQMGQAIAQAFASGLPDPETVGAVFAQIDMEILEPAAF